MATTNNNMSKDFFELVKRIGEAKSKQEEDRIMRAERTSLKQKMPQPDVASKTMREYLIRAIYCEMLGHESSFAYIHAVNLTQKSQMLEKMTGYLAVSLMLNPDHELMILLVNTLQRDMRSGNHLEVCTALTSVAKLCNHETIPALAPSVMELLTHSKEVVRKKAVVALYTFYQRAPHLIDGLQEKVRRVLCDKDPSVMGAGLLVLDKVAQEEPHTIKDLVPSFVSILKQITEHRLPREYDYHRMPAPWIQLRLLRILALLGASDQKVSEGMYSVLHDVLKRADTGINIGYAIIYEAVRTITSIYPNKQLLETAASNISRFIKSDNHNLKYLGINALALIVQIDASYAMEHQMAVIDCLEDSDETLKRRTLDLLFRMSNAANVVVIVEKLTTHLRISVDNYLREELVSRITQLAERYAPSSEWFITTMNLVFELGGDLVRPDVAHNLMRLIAEGSGEDEDADMELRRYAVSAYLDLLDKDHLPNILYEVIAWVLGEYAYVSEEDSLEDVMEVMCELMERDFEQPEVTRGYVLTALTKQCVQHGSAPDFVMDTFDKYVNSKHVELQQRCYEAFALLENMETMCDVLPLDAACEDIDVDETLAFLNGFVQEALDNGADPYIPPEEREDEFGDDDGAEGDGAGGAGGGGGGLRFEAYETPEMAQRKTAAVEVSHPIAAPPGMTNPIARATSAQTQTKAEVSTTGLNLSGVKKKWGKAGYAKDKAGAGAGGATVAESPSRFEPYSSETQASSPAYTSPSVPAAQEPTGQAPPPRASPPHGAHAPTAATTTPEKPVDGKKVKAANALFAGLGGGGGGGAAPAAESGGTPGRRGRRGRRAAQKAAAAAAAAGTAPAAAAPAAAPAPQSAAADLLDLDFGAPAAAPAAAAAPAPAASNDILDLMGDFGAPAPAPAAMPVAAAAPAAAPAAVSANIMDLMGDFGSPAPAPASPVAAASPVVGGGAGGGLLVPQAVDMNDLLSTGAVSSSLPANLSAYVSGGKTVPATPQSVAKDSMVEVTAYRVVKSDEIIVVTTTTNQSLKTLSNLTVTLEVPKTFDFTIVGHPMPEVRGSRCSVKTLTSRAKLVLMVRCKSKTYAENMVMRAQVAYFVDGESNNTVFTVPLKLCDVVRPNKLSTPQFGALWGALKQERKFTVQSSLSTIQDAFVAVQEKLGVHGVQVIGKEAISAGKTVGGHDVLVHVKVAQPNRVDVMVRSAERTLTEAMYRFALAALK